MEDVVDEGSLGSPHLILKSCTFPLRKKDRSLFSLNHIIGKSYYLSSPLNVPDVLR